MSPFATLKTSNILSEDFNYIGGLMNKTSEAYPSYAKAIKQLNLKNLWLIALLINVI